MVGWTEWNEAVEEVEDWLVVSRRMIGDRALLGARVAHVPMFLGVDVDVDGGGGDADMALLNGGVRVTTETKDDAKDDTGGGLDGAGVVAGKT